MRDPDKFLQTVRFSPKGWCCSLNEHFMVCNGMSVFPEAEGTVKQENWVYL